MTERSSGLAGAYSAPLVELRPEWEVGISSLMEKGRGKEGRAREGRASPLPEISPLYFHSGQSQFFFSLGKGNGQRAHGDYKPQA